MRQLMSLPLEIEWIVGSWLEPLLTVIWDNLDLIHLITTKLSKRRGPIDVQGARYLYILQLRLKVVRQRTSSDHRFKKSTTPNTTPNNDHPRTHTQVDSP